jgi:vitamin B12 transporter
MYLQKLRGRAFVLFLTLGSVSAAEPQKSVELTERVITATRTETERWRTASSVTVIDRKKIDEQQLKLLPDALRQVPGLVIADRGTPGSTVGIFLRGTNSDQTLVVIDGRPVPGNLAGLYNIETMALDNVERIEVLSGPASSLYGGKTLGGVINIITRSGKGLTKPESALSWEGGSFGFSRETLGTRGSAGIYDWSVELSRTDTQGYRINSQMQLTNTAAKFGAQLADTLRFDLDLRYYNADIGDPNNTDDPDNHLLTEFWSLSPRLVWDTTDRWNQTLTYQFGNFRQVATGYPFAGQNNRITSRNHFWEYQSVFRVTDKWTLSGGMSVQDLAYNRYNDDDNPLFFGFPTNPGSKSYDVDQEETNWALFLQSQAEILPGWNLTGGLRYDSYSDFGEATTWRAGTSWRMPWTQTILHANYGTAFAPASPQNREAGVWGFAGGELVNHQPELSKGLELGIEQPFADNKASISLTYFHNNIRNLIVYDPLLFALSQVNQARTQGLESAFNWQPSESFGFSAQYTYLDAKDTSAGKRLVRRPRHTVTSDIWVKPMPKLRLGVGALYIIDREEANQVDVEDYLRLRLTASYELSKNCDLFARVENLLGERYSEVQGFPAMRTGAFAGFRLRF